MPFNRGPVEPFLGGLAVHHFDFDNGLRLEVVPDRTVPVVAMQTWFRVGASDEVTGKTGLAHLFEHLMFKGTERYPEGEFQARVDAMGGSRHLNAWTWLDQTVYVGAVPATALASYAELESSRMNGLVVDEPAFRSEREVVINERRLVVDNDPDGLLDERLMAVAWPEHPYGRPTIGWQSDLDLLTNADASAFYRRWYAPDQATIIVVGDTEPEATAALIDRLYGQLPRSGTERVTPPAEPEQTDARRFELELPLAAERLQLILKVPGAMHADRPALLVLCAALVSGRSSRLVRALRDAGLVADVGASIPPLKHVSGLQISLTGRPDVPIDLAEQALWRELDRVAAEGMSEGEVALGVAQWETANWSRLNDASGRADFVGWALSPTGRLSDGLAQIAAIAAVTAEDVHRVARAYLRRDRSTTGIGRTGTTRVDRLATDLPAPVAPAARTHVEGRAPALLADRPADRVESTALGTATLFTAYDPVIPVVGFQLRFPVGGAADPTGREGTAALTAEMLLRGTRRRDRRAFEEALDQLGASLSASAAADELVIGGRCLTRTWPAVIALVREALVEPRFEASALAQLAEETVAELVASRDSDDHLADLALGRALYGAGHPYGRNSLGTEQSVGAVTVDDLTAFHARALRADRAVVGVSGAFDARITEDIRALLADLPAGPAWPVTVAGAPGGAPRVLLVDKPDRSQAQVRLGLTGLDARAPDFPAFVLFNEAFGVGFGGRLMKEVRVKRGWSYFAYSHPILRPTSVEWQAMLAPGNEYAVQAAALVRQLVDEAHGGLATEEIAQARATRLNGLPFEVDTAGKRLDLAIRRHTTGYDRVTATRAMEGLSDDAVNAAFRERIRAGDLVVVVVGTASVLQKDLEAAFGPVEVVPYGSL
jgi:zinc protease